MKKDKFRNHIDCFDRLGEVLGVPSRGISGWSWQDGPNLSLHLWRHASGTIYRIVSRSKFRTDTDSDIN